jgi:hypothetical protein
MQQRQQEPAQQQSALGVPQTMGTSISMQRQLKKMPSALSVPQMRISCCIVAPPPFLVRVPMILMGTLPFLRESMFLYFKHVQQFVFEFAG